MLHHTVENASTPIGIPSAMSAASEHQIHHHCSQADVELALPTDSCFPPPYPLSSCLPPLSSCLSPLPSCLPPLPSRPRETIDETSQPALQQLRLNDCPIQETLSIRECNVRQPYPCSSASCEGSADQDMKRDDDVEAIHRFTSDIISSPSATHVHNIVPPHVNGTTLRPREQAQQQARQPSSRICRQDQPVPATQPSQHTSPYPISYTLYPAHPYRIPSVQFTRTSPIEHSHYRYQFPQLSIPTQLSSQEDDSSQADFPDDTHFNYSDNDSN